MRQPILIRLATGALTPGTGPLVRGTDQLPITVLTRQARWFFHLR